MRILRRGAGSSRYSDLCRQLTNMAPTIKSIYERLEQAQKETRVVLTVEGRPNIVEMDEICSPESCWQSRRDMDRLLDKGTWQTEGPGFKQLREWVEVHWNPEDDKEAPNDTVATEDDWGLQREDQLDAVTATRKLIAAAKLFGPEQVGKYSAEFAAHGMIEVRRIYLLKGPPIEIAKPLDEYCTLLPYSDALLRIGAETDPTDFNIDWPEPHADNVCALEGRYLESASPRLHGNGQYTTPFLKNGPEQLAILLGLVWGSGFQVFGNWRGVHPAAVATLPYRHASMRSGMGSRSVSLPLQGYGPPIRRRPLAVKELHDLAAKYSSLPLRARSKVAKAMERLRASTDRIEYGDKIVDVGAALSILFMEDEEQDEPALLIPQRAAWYYSDSVDERRDTEDMLGEFFARHLSVVRGRALEGAGEEEFNRIAKLFADIDNVLRVCLKTMIAEGRPGDWNEAVRQTALRLDSPRTESEIPSVKSDSLSWSVEEQKQIDQALEAVWKPVVEDAPLPPSPAGSTIVSGVLSEIVGRYVEQGTPYVIPHPARLYMAHPKWPKTASDPLDEHERYYCERDVERHLRLWQDAAASRGLVQFEVPNDADSYHPKCRDDWPLPLLSSHEEDSSARSPSHRTVAGELASVRALTQSAVTDHEQTATAVEKPTDPPSRLPESVAVGLGMEWQRLWLAFQHDVNVLTDSLLYLLDAIHKRHLEERQRLVRVMGESGGALKTLEDAVRTAGNQYHSPKYPKLRGFPESRGEPLFVRTAPGGSMEQTAFNGWVVEVYSLWESSYRNQLKHEAREIPGAIRPRHQVLGDLGHIRNDLLHNGIAKRKEAAGCEILRWFSEGERVQVRLRHVFDFLNQMAWLREGPPPLVTEQGGATSWRMDKEREPEEPPPALISVRPFIDPQHQDQRYRYGASVVFENGVFGTTPMGPEREENEAQAKERSRKWMKMTVNESGDLYVPDLGTVPAAELYRSYLKGEVSRGPGIPGPSIQFRE